MRELNQRQNKPLKVHVISIGNQCKLQTDREIDRWKAVCNDSDYGELLQNAV